MKELKGRLEFTSEFEGKTVADIQGRLDQIMADRGEGLIIKHPNSEYILNGRNKDWIKVKPEYIVSSPTFSYVAKLTFCTQDNMGETVDVLVVAGNYGSGRRSGGVSTLICAVLDDRNTGSFNENEPKYV